MPKLVIIFMIVVPQLCFGTDEDGLVRFFRSIDKMEFSNARQIALEQRDESLRFELVQLSEILFFEGQVEKSRFKIVSKSNDKNKILSIVSQLEEGYLCLFYNQYKGDAFTQFYQAYQSSLESHSKPLEKACILALLRYYDNEIAQNSDLYLPYLKQYEQLQNDTIDRIWATIYKAIFYSKSLDNLDSAYFGLDKKLSECASLLTNRSPVLAKIYFERALQQELRGDLNGSKKFLVMTLNQSAHHNFLRNVRFSSFIKLMMIATRQGKFQEARSFLHNAKSEVNLADTLRSNYHLNLFASFMLNAQNRNDSAFALLKRAYAEDFQMDFRRNTLEINRLNVELETQEKENANLQLKQNRNWLISALAGVALLFVASYFAYTNQRSKNKIQAKEKEVQAMKLEKVLKDQEIFGIDAMIEGQEKERQRMAGDLHDNLGSLLAALKLHFHSLKGKKDFTESDPDELLQKTDALLEEAYQKVRGMAHAGNAGVNAQEGLLPAVKNFASKVSILNRLSIEVEEHGMNSRLENTLEITIFRIIQELITNIIKHAQASEVVIHLTHYEDTINLMVEDNGVGFDLSQVKPSGGMGLHSIQKKIENLGGRVTIDSIAQKGTTVIIDVPLT